MYFYRRKDSESRFQIRRYSPNFSLAILLILLWTGGSKQNLFGQFYEYGQDAGKLRWNYITSEHYKLIYPLGLDSLAMDFANKLEYFYPHQARVMDYEHKSIPVVFHNEASFSNGVFVWAPRRLEVFTNPDPNAFPQDWMTLLALHEGRHAFQVSKLNQGFSKGLSYIAGEQIVGAITGMLPIWYLEGDAVDAETRFSYSGRGRLPSFEMGTKARIIENGLPYSFTRSLLGSYNEHIPDHYELGYLMVRYARGTYGKDFWNDLEDLTAQKPYLLFPSWFSMRKYGINSKNELFNATMEFYGAHWRESFEKRSLSNYETWHRLPKYYTNYTYPQWMNDSLMIAMKSGFEDIPAFVTLDKYGREERIFRPGYLNSGRFSYGKGKIVWDEWVADLRWSNRNYSIIRIYDMETKKVRNLGLNTRYFAPALSHDGSKIVTVEQAVNQDISLVVLNLEGQLLDRINPPVSSFLQHPCWMAEDSTLLAIVSDIQGEKLMEFSFEERKWKLIFDAGYEDISNPEVRGSEVVFSAGFSGIDNIYSYHLSTKELCRISKSMFGAFYPSLGPDAQEIFYSDYHSHGYRAVKASPLREPFSLDKQLERRAEQIAFESTKEEKEILAGQFEIPDTSTYEPKPYSKLKNPINIHSWSPFYYNYMNPEVPNDPENIPLSPGISLLSQNLLSTVTGMVAYEYRDSLHYFHAGVRLKGKYPVIDFSVDYGGYPQIDSIEGESLSLLPHRISFNVDTYIPFRFYTGKYITLLQPYFAYNYTSDIGNNLTGNSYVQGIHRIHSRIYFASYQRMSKMDINPRLGLILYGGYLASPFTPNFGQQVYAGSRIYLPGITRHHSLKLFAEWQSLSGGKYYLPNSISNPRGFPILWSPSKSMYSLDYSFPVSYPDLSIDPVLYIKRLRATVWTDMLHREGVYIPGENPSFEDRNDLSLGMEVYADLHLFRFFYGMAPGVRISYLPEYNMMNVEFLFSLDL